MASPTKINFKGDATFASDAPLEKINGTASGTGKLNFDIKAVKKMTGSFQMPVKSMKTGNKKRDQHLRGKVWLNAKKCPNVGFKIKKAKLIKHNNKGKVHKASVKVTGKFELNCKKKKLTTTVNLKWKGNQYKATTRFKVALKDFGVEGSKGTVGSKVGKEIDVKVTFKGKGK